MFIEKHKVYGNKWSEIGKFLNGRNDNAVKNYFYSSVRKIVRKVSLRKPFDANDTEVEKELIIYLTEYILQMYQNYLNRKRGEKDNGTKFKIVDGLLSQDQEMEYEEEKDESSQRLRSGDKYVIRKLISLKLTPEIMQEYVNMLKTG